ncbi:hypothetical protein HGM15179_015888, partial [Zosterops borbonicus]
REQEIVQEWRALDLAPAARMCQGCVGVLEPCHWAPFHCLLSVSLLSYCHC